MKCKCFLLVLCVIFCSQCRSKEKGIVHVDENGIEVVSNPLQVSGKTNIRFELERSLLSNAAGIPDDVSFGRIFNMDENGNWYVADTKNTSILVLNQKGDFVKKIGGPGEGPGFFMDVRDIFFTKEEIGVLEESRISYFSKDGSFLRQMKLPLDYSLSILPNGNILRQAPAHNPNNPADIKFQLIMAAPDGKPIVTLDSIQMFNPLGARIKGCNYSISVARSKDILYVYSQDREYEIWAYDFSGKLLRRIKKEHLPVTVSAEYKNDFISEIKPLYDRIKDRLYFPEYMPPIHCLFTDEEGFLFVVTYEKSKEKDGYLVDVFNPKGECIAQTVMPLDSLVKPAAILLKNHRLYRIFQKMEDVEEFSVSRYAIEK
ncbi:MAG: 6-bladed beta-propeller [Acidobacteria bacterium]|nr:6-bladed beta-propeller [Acidobacteriota bacterium]MBU4403997.1 6-bladed beta-propeller [Acidobacteriota bacterium]MCG2811909.1 6-bladed beta-propeller [Candidatus Aminicenantes bacterium]